MQATRLLYRDREVEDYGKTAEGRVIHIPGLGLVCVQKAEWIRVIRNGKGQHTEAEAEEDEG